MGQITEMSLSQLEKRIEAIYQARLNLKKEMNGLFDDPTMAGEDAYWKDLFLSHMEGQLISLWNEIAYRAYPFLRADEGEQS